MLLKKEFHGSQLESDVIAFWCRDISIEQCQDETGLDIARIKELYNQYQNEMEAYYESLNQSELLERTVHECSNNL